MWWKRRVDLHGMAFFSGALPPTLDSLAGLAKAGVEVTPLAARANEVWSATLRHRAWGEARLSAPRDASPLQPDFVGFASGLTEGERRHIALHARRPLLLELPAQSEHVLRDRKRLLRYLGAILAGDGVAGFDLLAQMIWTPARIEDELSHDAPLDIIQVHVLHAVTNPGGVWLHSHGLGELGHVDFDILRPAEALTVEQFDVVRAIAYAIVEGSSSGNIVPVSYADPIALVDAATFMSSAAESDTALRDARDHTERRVVCCEADAPGFFGRLFGKKDIRPSKLLSAGIVEGRHLIQLSKSATELDAQRARDSLDVFDRLRAELEELRCTPVIKLGYATDSNPENNEHLWFEVHDLSPDSIDATLLNSPFDVARLRANERGQHPRELVTDWALVTPFGQLTPRSLELARKLREHRSEILKALAQSG